MGSEETWVPSKLVGQWHLGSGSREISHLEMGVGERLYNSF